jgi:manganese transport protein
MIASQALNVAVLPATVACIIYLGNRTDLMGAYRHSLTTNIILAAIFLFSLVTSYMGFQGLLAMVSG